MIEKEHIFLGHASEDKPRVRELYRHLKAAGLSPWLDAEDLVPGQNWRTEIPKAIKSAAIFLACFSKTSIVKRGYVQQEFRTALSTYAELPPGSIYLIPVRLDECDLPDSQLPELGVNLRDLHWVDFFEEKDPAKLVAAIRLKLAQDTKYERTPLTAPKPISSEIEVFRSIDTPWCPEMVVISSGSFLMGSLESEAGRTSREGPQHEVIIGRPFALGRSAVTFQEYDHFCEVVGRKKPDDSGWKRGRRPVINVTHHDAVAYCEWLSEATGVRYQLPTEAMWEYACRAGTTTPFSFGANITTDQVNYDGKFPYAGGSNGRCREETVLVGTLPANPWGLCEMHGNVWEWCADRYSEYPTSTVTDPQGASNGTSRVIRGGSWDDSARLARSAHRNRIEPGFRDRLLGFRCAAVQEL